jgi:cysteine desulfurase
MPLSRRYCAVTLLFLAEFRLFRPEYYTKKRRGFPSLNGVNLQSMSHYLDHNATAPLLPEALEAMTLAAKEGWANPSSLHEPGRRSKQFIEDAREKLAALIQVDPSTLVFTGGGTEACNFALFGAVQALQTQHKGRHLIISAIEHPAIKSGAKSLEEQGWQITWIKPNSDGVIETESVEKALRQDTVLCSVMAANNEVGTVQPIHEIGTLLREKGVLFFCDMTQALGKLPVDLSKTPVDLAAFVAHKIGGPKGVGALYIRKGIRLESLLRGGGQERGLRGGTENVPGIAGYGAAAEWWQQHGDEERRRVESLRDQLQSELQKKIPEIKINAANVSRLPNTLHATFPGCRSDVLVMALDLRSISASAGSACASGSVKPSEVLLAMGRSSEEAMSSSRFSLGFGNTAEEIPAIVEALAQVCQQAKG